MSSTTAPAGAAQPWYAAFPEPKDAAPAALSRDAVLQRLRDSAPGDRAFVLVDVRRADHEGGTVRGSLNLPAQSLYPSLPTLHRVFKAAGVREVIWYCGSSRGRGTRAAAWFRDYLEAQGETAIASVILSEGIKGWAAAGPEFVAWMDGYDASVWGEKKDDA
ncbi:Rhodanese-like domain-containing protein [Durotheca rogersii]|uniref:Rhodanese-like domain-containing protein n=1 Tax=Durotheca rogersii TaxID=419775 RepID=UPI002220CD06|nr:Rhodanese-like domain-containing protein [Durotheca rogersii]KAI5862480.1 Rhodanese-like domain-containing protein [Durotheca rogersii]